MSEPIPIPDLPVARLSPEGAGERLLTGIGATVDAALVRAMQLAVDAVLRPAPRDLPDLRASAEPMLDAELQRDPARFFAFGEPRPVAVSRRYERRISGGVARGLRFALDYRPFGGGPHTDRWLLVEHWRRQRGARGTIVLLHGFTMGHPRFDAFALFASHWFRRGLDVAIVTLPFHGARSPKGARFSGEQFAVPDVARFAEAVRQATFELRALTGWLRSEGGSAAVGLLGLSLGGYLAALHAGLYDDLDFAVTMVPPVCIGDLAWRFQPGRRPGRVPPAFSYPELRAAYRIHSPLAFSLRLPPERVLIVAGRGDRVVPPEHPHALWRHWGEPAIHWFSGSHLAPFRRGRIAAAIGRHLNGVGL